MVIIKTKEYEIVKYGQSTYCVVDNNGTCTLATSSLLKAKNHLKRIFKYTNSNETI